MGRSDDQTGVMLPWLGCSQSFLKSGVGPWAQDPVLARLPSRVRQGGSWDARRLRRIPTWRGIGLTVAYRGRAFGAV